MWQCTKAVIGISGHDPKEGDGSMDEAEGLT